MAKPWARKSWELPGGERKVIFNGQEITLAELNYTRWLTGVMLAPSILRPHQMPLYLADTQLKASEISVQVCSRQYGKSYEKLAVSVEKAIQRPESRNLFAFPGKGQGEGIIEQNVLKIFKTCPPELAPEIKLADGKIRFPRNSSQIVIAGTDDRDQREKLRGSGSPFIVVDEAGSHKNLRYLVDDLLGPQLDNYDGSMVLNTTPPNTMDHEFVDYWEEAKRTGRCLVMPITANTFYSRERKLAICARANRLPAEHPDVALILDGKMEGSPTWEREYMCRMVADKSLRVCPDFVDGPPHVQEFQRPLHSTHYVFIDQGYHDFFAAVFASQSMGMETGSRLYVEDVWMGKKMATDQIVTELKRKEKELGWTTPPRRFANDPRGEQQVRDMRQRGYHVTQGPKSEGSVMEADRANLALSEGKLVVHARCKALRDQMLSGIFKVNEAGKADFMRSENFGHLDAFAALAMGLRHVDWRRNIAPAAEYDMNNWIVPGSRKVLTPTEQAVWGLFSGVRKN